MNKEEQLKQKIRKAEAAIFHAKDAFEQACSEFEQYRKKKTEYGWWRPQEFEQFLVMDEQGLPQVSVLVQSPESDPFVSCLNCFKTTDELLLEFERTVLDRKVRDIALRLNKGRKVDWTNSDQPKYRLEVTLDDEGEVRFNSYTTYFRGDFKEVVCLEPAFAKVAKEELHQRFKGYFDLKDEIEKENDVNRRTNKGKNK